jgi:hypothetical protein
MGFQLCSTSRGEEVYHVKNKGLLTVNHQRQSIGGEKISSFGKCLDYYLSMINTNMKIT